MKCNKNTRTKLEKPPENNNNNNWNNKTRRQHIKIISNEQRERNGNRANEIEREAGGFGASGSAAQ